MKVVTRVALLTALLLCAVASSQAVSAATLPAVGSQTPAVLPAAPAPAPAAQGCSGSPNIQYGYANPPVINAGQVTTLYWGLVGNASAAYLVHPNGHRVGIGTPGSQQVNPTQNTTYLILAVCGGNQVTLPITVTVNNNPGCNGSPQITSFSANPTNIRSGQSTTLSWGIVANAQYVQLSSQNQGGSGVPTPGSIQVSPNQTTTYYLTAWCQGNSVQQQVTINVSNPPPPPPPAQGNQISNISMNGALSKGGSTVFTANYYWNGQDAPAVLQGTAYNGAGQPIGQSNATRIDPNRAFYVNLNFRVNSNQVARVSICMIGSSGTELVCQNGGK